MAGWRARASLLLEWATGAFARPMRPLTHDLPEVGDVSGRGLCQTCSRSPHLTKTASIRAPVPGMISLAPMSRSPIDYTGATTQRYSTRSSLEPVGFLAQRRNHPVPGVCEEIGRRSQSGGFSPAKANHAPGWRHLDITKDSYNETIQPKPPGRRNQSRESSSISNPAVALALYRLAAAAS